MQENSQPFRRIGKVFLMQCPIDDIYAEIRIKSDSARFRNIRPPDVLKLCLILFSEEIYLFMALFYLRCKLQFFGEPSSLTLTARSIRDKCWNKTHKKIQKHTCLQNYVYQIWKNHINIFFKKTRLKKKQVLLSKPSRFAYMINQNHKWHLFKN